MNSAHDSILKRVAFYLWSLSGGILTLLGLLALQGIEAPDILVGGLLTSFGTTSGALGSLLVKGGSEGPQEVVTPHGQSLDVTEVEYEG